MRVKSKVVSARFLKLPIVIRLILRDITPSCFYYNMSFSKFNRIIPLRFNLHSNLQKLKTKFIQNTKLIFEQPSIGETLISALSGFLYSSFSANSHTKCAPNLTPPAKVISLYLTHSNTALRSSIYSKPGMLALSSPKLYPNYATSHNAVTGHLTHAHT